jgi:uncharacterized protein (DUF1499 family)
MKKVLWSLPVFVFISSFSFAQHTPASGGPLKACPESPNCVTSQAAGRQHAVAPFVYAGNRDTARARLMKVLAGMKRMKIVAEREDYLHAEATSLIFRFVDDVEFYFPADERIIHVRSASRKGYSDLGVNRKRVEEIRRRFNEER